MPKYMVDIWMDGYDSEEEMERACEDFIHSQLDLSAGHAKITKVPDSEDLLSKAIESFREDNKNLSQKEIKEKYEQTVKKTFQDFENRRSRIRKYI